jgi:hypothetical protein
LNPAYQKAGRVTASNTGIKARGIILTRALKPEEAALIKEAVSSGSNLVFDGVPKLHEDLGIELQEEAISVKQARDYQFPDIPLFWPKAQDVRPIFRANEKDYKILCVDEETDLPLVVSGKYGKGGFLYFAALFDPVTEKGYSRFPFLIEMLNTAFDYTPLAERKAVEMYFDPGMRQFISIEKLAKLWRKNGVNRIYAGGWHFYDKYSYDYNRLIRVCHENGILVYCWLEPPMVNQKFWNKYPAWREKTALLKDGKVGWRFLMNLADSRCREKAFDDDEALLMKYDWDGVNLAELYFESPLGPSRPESFTPMNDTVRKEYKKLAGYDPVELFDPQSPHYWQTSPVDWQQFARYRRDLCTRLKDYYLAFLSKIRDKKKKDFEIMLTAIDATQAPQLEDNLAEDTAKLLSLQKKYDFTLQVEDSSPFWSGKPERYAALGAWYRNVVKDPSRLVLDCNVLDTNHPKGEGGLPAEKPAGEEIRHIVYNMAASGCRAAFYSEETLFEHDYQNIATVLAREARITFENEVQWKITTPYTVTVKTGKKELITRLDDDLWFAGEGDSVIVPAGEHTLRFESEPRYFDTASLKPRLAYISSELKWANFFNNAIELSYSDETAPCYVIVSKRPSKVYVDNKRISATVLEGDSGFSVRLPAGAHVAKIYTGGNLGYLVETSGVVLFSLIIIFGFFTSILLLGLFIAIQIKRKLAL